MQPVLILHNRDTLRQRVNAAAVASGFPVIEACESADEALTYVHAQRPSVVFMDMAFAEQPTALATIQAILDVHPATLVVACSAFGSSDMMGKAFEAGAHRCLGKPVRIEDAVRLFEQLHRELKNLPVR